MEEGWAKATVPVEGSESRARLPSHTSYLHHQVSTFEQSERSRHPTSTGPAFTAPFPSELRRVSLAHAGLLGRHSALCGRPATSEAKPVSWVAGKAKGHRCSPSSARGGGVEWGVSSGLAREFGQRKCRKAGSQLQLGGEKVKSIYESFWEISLQVSKKMQMELHCQSLKTSLFHYGDNNLR